MRRNFHGGKALS